MVGLSLRRRLGGCHQVGEHFRIMHRQIGQYLAIQINPGQLKPVHKAAVAHSVLACSCVNASDPKATEIPSAGTPVAIAVPQRLHHRFVGSLEETMFGPSLAFSEFQYLLVSSSGLRTPFYSSHDSSSSLRSQIRCQASDTLPGAAALDLEHLVKQHLDSVGLPSAQVALADFGSHQLASAGVTESFGGRFMGLYLRHVLKVNGMQY